MPGSIHTSLQHSPCILLAITCAATWQPRRLLTCLSRLAGLSSAASTQAALPLVLLSSAYAHQGQVTYAEGFLRKAADLLHLSADATAPGADNEHSGSAQESPERATKAMVAQHMAQLYAAMPRRGTEADKWAQLAQMHWPFGDNFEGAAGSGGLQTLRTQLGGADAMSADGVKGMEPVVSFVLRRVFLSSKERSDF